jgi:regulator of sirC expression with transglutaminase-like and TPR domain
MSDGAVSSPNQPSKWNRRVYSVSLWSGFLGSFITICMIIASFSLSPTPFTPVQAAQATPTMLPLHSSTLNNLEESMEEIQWMLAQILYHQGFAYSTSEDYDLAIAFYTTAIQLAPDYSYAYINRGIDYHKQENYELAIADYTRAIEIDPEYWISYYNRGLLYYHQQNYELAIADYTHVIELAPQPAWGYNNRGLAYYYNNQPEAALVDWQMVEQLGGSFTSEAEEIYFRLKPTVQDSPTPIITPTITLTPVSTVDQSIIIIIAQQYWNAVSTGNYALFSILFCKDVPSQETFDLVISMPYLRADMSKIGFDARVTGDQATVYFTGTITLVNSDLESRAFEATLLTPLDFQKQDNGQWFICPSEDTQ